MWISFLGLLCVIASDAQKPLPEKAAWDRGLRELQREKPTEYRKMRTTLTAAAQITLAQLGYGTGPFDGILDEKTQSALREYQKNRGLPITGDPLSFETVEQLRADGDAHNYRPTSLPSFHVFTDLWDSGYVSASGTWVISGERLGFPEQTSKINCDRSLRTCTEATAILSGGGGDRRLSVDIDTYEIERWDEHDIATKPLQFGCTRYVTRLNRLQKSVTAIRSTTSNDGMCSGTDRAEKYLVLTDGFKVYWELEQERREKWREITKISPDLLNVLESQAK
jgi:hypothetical protein